MFAYRLRAKCRQIDVKRRFIFGTFTPVTLVTFGYICPLRREKSPPL